MTRTPEQQTEWEHNCYGMSQAKLNEQIKEAFNNPLAFGYQDYGKMAFDLLSDAQTVLEFGDDESARKKMNCAKHILAEHVFIPRSFEKKSCKTCRYFEPFVHQMDDTEEETLGNCKWHEEKPLPYSMRYARREQMAVYGVDGSECTGYVSK